MLVEIWLRCARHPGARFGPEILDDDFLDVPVALVQIAQRQQRLDALAPGLADADQNAAGERHRRFPGVANGFEPHLRVLVGRAEMRAAAPAQALGRALQHDPLRHRNPTQPVEIGSSHDAGVQVRQQAGFAQDQPGHFGQVGERRLVAQPIECLVRRGIAQFRLVAQGEERLMAARLGPGAGDRQHLLGTEINGLARARRMREGAVMAHVAA